MLIKLNECYKDEPWYTDKPVLVLEYMKTFDYYRIDLEWASFR